MHENIPLFGHQKLTENTHFLFTVSTRATWTSSTVTKIELHSPLTSTLLGTISVKISNYEVLIYWNCRHLNKWFSILMQHLAVYIYWSPTGGISVIGYLMPNLMEMSYFCSHMCKQVVLHWSGRSLESLLGSLWRRMQFSDTVYKTKCYFPTFLFPLSLSLCTVQMTTHSNI